MFGYNFFVRVTQHILEEETTAMTNRNARRKKVEDFSGKRQ